MESNLRVESRALRAIKSFVDLAKALDMCFIEIDGNPAQKVQLAHRPIPNTRYIYVQPNGPFTSHRYLVTSKDKKLGLDLYKVIPV